MDLCAGGREFRLFAGMLPGNGGEDWYLECRREPDGEPLVVACPENLGTGDVVTGGRFCAPHRRALLEMAANGWLDVKREGQPWALPAADRA